MHPSIITEDVIDELQTVLVERTFTSNWEKVLMYHDIGKSVQEYKDTLKKDTLIRDDAELCYFLSSKLKKSPNTVWYAFQFYNRFPDLDKAPFAKDTTWPRIIKEYLTALPKKLPGDYLIVTASPVDLERALHKGKKDYKYNSMIAYIDGESISLIGMIFSLKPLKEEAPKANKIVYSKEEFNKQLRSMVPEGTLVINL